MLEADLSLMPTEQSSASMRQLAGCLDSASIECMVTSSLYQRADVGSISYRAVASRLREAVLPHDRSQEPRLCRNRAHASLL